MIEPGISGTGAAHRLFVLLCLAVLPTACGDNDLLPKKPSRPIKGCETHELAACDTRATACQQARLELAACMRRVPHGAVPPVTVLTEQEYVDYTNALYEGRDSPVNHFESAMTWLGLAQPGSFQYIPLKTEDVASYFGTYRWRENDLVLIDHGRPADDEASNVALMGTLIRLLRDRDLDIGTWSTVVDIVDIDSRWGGDALYFGEARFYANRYRMALEGHDPSEADALTPINQSIREDVDWIRAQPSAFLATNDRFPHNFGARAMHLAWQREEVDGINSLFESKRLTQQLMASETEELAPPAVRHHEQPVAPSRWYEEPTITALGAWGLFLSLSQHLEPSAAWKLALDWHGDTIYVYKSAEAEAQPRTALVWQLESAEESSASALEVALSAGIPNAEVHRSGTFVTLAVSNDDSSLDWAFVDE